MTDPNTSDAPAFDPADGLIRLIVAFLAPMFLGVSDGNIQFARAAAMQTVRAYQARHHADLIAVAQIIAYGLAALGSLSLSMADDLSLSMTLRLRGNANALNRSAEQNRRALRQSRPAPISLDNEQSPTDDQSEAEILAALARTRDLVTTPRPANATAQTPEAISTPPMPAPAEMPTSAEMPTPAKAAQDHAKAPPPAKAPASAEMPAPAEIPAPARMPAPTKAPAPAKITEQDIQAMWATAMTDVAQEFAGELSHLPPQERRLATMRIKALSSTASTLMSGTAPPDSARVTWPRSCSHSTPRQKPANPAKPQTGGG